jgi:hypothetical protein
VLSCVVIVRRVLTCKEEKIIETVTLNDFKLKLFKYATCVVRFEVFMAVKC